jgi:hypothetical protein
VGTGLSIGAGLPGGSRLAEWLRGLDLADEIDFDAMSPSDHGHCVQVADEIAKRDPGTETELRRQVCEYLDLERNPGVQVTGTHEALVRTPGGVCLTLNYDLLLEEAAERQELDRPA